MTKKLFDFSCVEHLNDFIVFTIKQIFTVNIEFHLTVTGVHDIRRYFRSTEQIRHEQNNLFNLFRILFKYFLAIK